MVGVAIRMLVPTLLTFKKVKLIFGHPIYAFINNDKTDMVNIEIEKYYYSKKKRLPL